MDWLRFLAPLLAGLASHQTNGFFERWEAQGTPGAWIRLARYAVGTIFLLPSFVLLINGDRRKKTLAQVYMTNATLFGAGVGLGYVVDELRWDGEEE